MQKSSWMSLLTIAVMRIQNGRKRCKLLFYMQYEHLIFLLKKKIDFKWLLFTFSICESYCRPKMKNFTRRDSFCENFLHKIKFMKLEVAKFRNFGDSQKFLPEKFLPFWTYSNKKSKNSHLINIPAKCAKNIFKESDI